MQKNRILLFFVGICLMFMYETDENVILKRSAPSSGTGSAGGGMIVTDEDELKQRKRTAEEELKKLGVGLPSETTWTYEDVTWKREDTDDVLARYTSYMESHYYKRFSNVDAYRCLKFRPKEQQESLKWTLVWKNDQTPVFSSTFPGKELFEFLRGKKMAILGDSMGRQLYFALNNVLQEYLIKSGITPDKPTKLNQPYSHFQFSLTYKRFNIMNNTEDLEGLREMMKERPDIVVLHHDHHTIAEYSETKRDTYFYNIVKDVNNIVQEICDKMSPEEQKKTRIFWREVDERHYGDLTHDTGGTCFETGPYLDWARPVTHERIRVNHRNLILKRLTESSGPFQIELLKSAFISGLRRDSHIARRHHKHGWYDCSHFCVPGVPDLWVHQFLRQLSKEKVK